MINDIIAAVKLVAPSANDDDAKRVAEVIEAERGETTRSMLENESKSQHTTRPRIAWGCFLVLAAVSCAVVLVWAFAAVTGRTELVSAMMDGWPFVASIVLPFVTLLYGYFGILKTESRDRLNAATGVAPVAGGIIKKLFKKGS